jgi:cold shock CspA family protein
MRFVYDLKQQYGFIQAARTGSIYFHFSALDKGLKNQVHVGDKLSFFTVTDREGRPKAVQIAKAASTSDDSRARVLDQAPAALHPRFAHCLAQYRVLPLQFVDADPNFSPPPSPPLSAPLSLRPFDQTRLEGSSALSRPFPYPASGPVPVSSTVQPLRGGSGRDAEERPMADGGGVKEMGKCVKINRRRASSLHLGFKHERIQSVSNMIVCC